MSANHIKYLRRVGEKHRKEYGQFFTHPEVARFMVRWVLKSGEWMLFDPAVGLGAFFDSVADDPSIEFAGSEIDPKILDFWTDEVAARKVEIANEDYLLSWGKSHANIVCNPPYMRFQKFIDRDAVFRAFVDNLGLRLSGYTNTASAFLLKSISELNGAGRLAYLMPLEFLNTGYGSIVKKCLIENGHLVAIIELNCEKDIFPDAITSVGIILYDASRHYAHVDFHTADAIPSLARILESEPTARVAWEQLNPNSKWLSYFQTIPFVVNHQKAVPLNHYGRFSRGIATGANEFFVLRPSRARTLGINGSEAVPCIAKSSQIRQPVFGRGDYDALVRDDAPVLLFSVNKRHSKRAAAYIRSGEQRGYNTRFLTKSRSPWYKTETREPAPLLLGVFSRGGYKIIRNRSEVLNLTCFHGFRPNIFGMAYLDRLFLYLASASGRDIVSLSARRYGDALDKFEPNDLNNALVPSQQVFDELSAKEVAKAVRHVESTGKSPDWIDAFFAKLKTPADGKFLGRNVNDTINLAR